MSKWSDFNRGGWAEAALKEKGVELLILKSVLI